MAAYSKTQDIVLLAHQAVTHPDTIKGTEVDVSTKLSAQIALYHALVEAAANTNPGSFYVQTSPASSGHEDWVTVAQFTPSSGTPATEAMTATEPADETVLAVASTTGFAAGDLLYIQDTGTLADSEWGQCQEIVTNTSIDLIDGLANAKDSSDVVWNLADRFVCDLDLSAVARVRVVFQHEGATGANAHIKALMTTGDTIG